MCSNSLVNNDFHTSQRTRIATETVISGRKSWKTLKEKNEAVWPPYLEAALIEALEKYRPGRGGDTRMLRRFPKRNRWISEYIQKTTGKVRTAKQVGSRIQQLRDTCEEARILNLISRKEYSPEPDASSQSSPDSAVTAASSSSPAPSIESPQSDVLQLASEIISERSYPKRHVTIDIVPPGICSTPNPMVNMLSFTFEPNSMLLRQDENHHRITITTDEPLWSKKPTVYFSVSQPIDTHDYLSFFRVFLDGVHVHSETAEIELCSRTETQYIYGAKMIPQYWPMLCENSDLSHCQITQEIVRASTFQVVLSTLYGFNLHPHATPQFNRYPWWSDDPWGQSVYSSESVLYPSS